MNVVAATWALETLIDIDAGRVDMFVLCVSVQAAPRVPSGKINTFGILRNREKSRVGALVDVGAMRPIPAVSGVTSARKCPRQVCACRAFTIASGTRRKFTFVVIHTLDRCITRKTIMTHTVKTMVVGDKSNRVETLGMRNAVVSLKFTLVNIKTRII